MVTPGVPNTAEDRKELLAERPPAWEYLLFAGVLLHGKRDLELRWRDHQLRLPTTDYHRVGDDDVTGYLSEAFDRLAWIIEPVSWVFEGHEEAFGEPGEPGDPALIEHFGRWIVSVYARLLEWAGTVRSAGVARRFERALELSARVADMPIDQIRGFLEQTVAQIAQMPEHIAKPQPHDEQLRTEISLTLTTDEQARKDVIDAVRAARAQR